MRWEVARKFLKTPNTWECDFCESNNLREKRNCDWSQPGECRVCGSVEFEDTYTDPKKSTFLCQKCDGSVTFKGEFRLGKTYRTPGCPKSQITDLSKFLVSLVFWSEETGRLPTATVLLEESLLYFEVRNFVISEKMVTEEELAPKEKN